MVEHPNIATIFIHGRSPKVLNGRPTASESLKLSQEFQKLNRSLREKPSDLLVTTGEGTQAGGHHKSRTRESHLHRQGHTNSPRGDHLNESEESQEFTDSAETYATKFKRKGQTRKVSWAEEGQANSLDLTQGPNLTIHPEQPVQSMDINQVVEELHDAGKRFAEEVHPYVHAYLSLPPGVNPLVPHVMGPAMAQSGSNTQGSSDSTAAIIVSTRATESELTKIPQRALPPAGRNAASSATLSLPSTPRDAPATHVQCVIYGEDLRRWAAGWGESEVEDLNFIVL